MGARAVVIAVAAGAGLAWAAPAAQAQAAQNPESITLSPVNAIIAPGERLTIQAQANFRGGADPKPVACRWELVAQRGQARLARGKDGRPTTAAILEAGTAPSFVVVRAVHITDDDVVYTVKTTVLCSRPVLVAPARVAVGEPGPLELTLPLLPREREGLISVAVLEQPEGGKAQLVGMRDGEFGPVGGNYAVKMPVRGGSLQVGLRVHRPGRYVIQGKIRVGEHELATPPTALQAVAIASLQVCAWQPGPSPKPAYPPAGPAGHGVPGPFVIQPPQAVAPVVLGFGPDGEALGILSSTSTFIGTFVDFRGQQRLQPQRLSNGIVVVDEKPVPLPPPGSVVRRALHLTVYGGVLRADRKIRSGLVVCEPLPAPAIPIPVGGTMRLGLALQGLAGSQAGTVQLQPLQGRAAYAMGPEGTAVLEVEPQSAIDAVIRAKQPGLAQVRSRCALRDQWGGEGRLRLITEFLAVAPDQVVVCDRLGRPVAGAVRPAWAVAGAAKVVKSGDGATIALPPGVAAAGKARNLAREGGELWLVPVRRKQP